MSVPVPVPMSERVPVPASQFMSAYNAMTRDETAVPRSENNSFVGIVCHSISVFLVLIAPQAGAIPARATW